MTTEFSLPAEWFDSSDSGDGAWVSCRVVEEHVSSTSDVRRGREIEYVIYDEAPPQSPENMLRAALQAGVPVKVADDAVSRAYWVWRVYGPWGPSKSHGGGKRYRVARRRWSRARRILRREGIVVP